MLSIPIAQPYVPFLYFCVVIFVNFRWALVVESRVCKSQYGESNGLLDVLHIYINTVTLAITVCDDELGFFCSNRRLGSMLTHSRDNSNPLNDTGSAPLEHPHCPRRRWRNLAHVGRFFGEEMSLMISPQRIIHCSDLHLMVVHHANDAESISWASLRSSLA